MNVFFLILGPILGYIIGWGCAHHVIATECKKLGKFYVGEEVFECRKIEDKGQ